MELDSVLQAAEVVGGLGTRLEHAPAGRALRRAADAVPGGRLAAAAGAEAAEWSRESAALTALLDDLARGLRQAAVTYRSADESLAAGIPHVSSPW